MPALKSLLNLLDKSKIKYEVLEHKTVYTAMDKAATLHTEPKMVVKTAVVKLGAKDYALALIPAHKLLDKKKFLKIANDWRKKQIGKNSHGRIRIAEARRAKARYSHADFATEAWMKKNLSGKVGATPPFGRLWKLPTFVDNNLLRQPKLIVNAGDYNFSLKLTRAGFEKAVGEIIKGNFSQAP